MNEEHDMAAYTEGFNTCIDLDGNNKPSKNPYPKETIEWRSWNRGWNAALDHLEP
jgi:hypothetical protein